MVSPTFAAWAAMHGKSYNGNDELVVREQIYNDNVAKIEAHNAKNLSFSMAVNVFADLSEDEFVAKYTGLLAKPLSLSDVDLGALPEAELFDDEVDWVQKGAVNPIKDQGQCGSCWAFSTMGTLESAYKISTGQLHSLAEQQLVDCDWDDDGCSGGWPHTALESYGYLSKAGVCSESSYAYTAKKGYCMDDVCDVVLPQGTVVGHQNVGQTSTGLKSALSSQPVSVTVNAEQLQFASNGVVTGACSGQVNHAVIAVGYGTDGLDYFKIRNSWGTSWGEAGYIRLAQDGGSEGTACLLQYAPVVPQLATESVSV
jgi:C1A family cysteine protease